jgi:hypothetical protein
VPMLRMTAFLVASLYGGAAGVPLRPAHHPLRRAGDVQHRQHVPAARHGDHRRAAETSSAAVVGGDRAGG